MVAFYGTFSGMAAAMVGGLVATIVLFIMKKTMVHQKFVVTTKPTKVLNFTLHTPRGKWEERQPDWRDNG